MRGRMKYTWQTHTILFSSYWPLSSLLPLFFWHRNPLFVVALLAGITAAETVGIQRGWQKGYEKKAEIAAIEPDFITGQ